MILHDLTPGMHPRRVRIFMAEKGLSVERREVDAANNANSTAEFLKLNPLGRLPVLELDDGSAISESLAICRYLENLHPNPPLMGQTPQEAAQIEMWTLRMENNLSRPIGYLFMHSSDFYKSRLKQVPAVAEWAKKQAFQTMEWLNTELAKRTYIAGESYTMPDIVAQCAFVLGKAVGVRIPPEMTHLTRWFATVSARPTARA